MMSVTKLTLTLVITFAAVLTGATFLGTASAETANSSAAPAQADTPVVVAQNPQSDQVRGLGFVDANSDGICDRRATRGQGQGRGRGFVDANGDGICDNQRAGAGRRGSGRDCARGGFVDADGDGICDNQGAGGQRCGRGRGQGMGQGCGRGNR